MIFSFACLIPTTLFTQELIKFYQVSPVLLDFNPSFSSPRNTGLTDTLAWEILSGCLSLGNVILVPSFTSAVCWRGPTAVEKMGKNTEKLVLKCMIYLLRLLRLE